MANVVYNNFKYAFANLEINLLTDNIYILLVNNYSVDIDNDEFVSDINGYQISGVGYTSGGKLLSNRALVRDDINDRIRFSASDVNWDNSSISARGAIIYKNTGVTSSSPLICYIDFGQVKNSNNTSFKIEWSTQEGILYIR